MTRRTGARSAALRAAREIRARRSVNVAYHGLGQAGPGDDPEFLQISPERFRTQVELLLDAGFEFLTVAELVRRADGGAPEPGLASISFDDGMEDNHSVALPILRELGVPATIYVTTGLIGKANPWMPAASGARMMFADELREMAAAGIELGAHTVTHPDMSQLDEEACLDEMVRSSQAIEEITGVPVETFAYPFCRYGQAAVAAAERAGFTAAVTCEGRGGWSRYEMKRALITGKDGLPTFLLKLADAYQPLFESPPGRAVRKATRGGRQYLRALTAGARSAG